jgi:hypothetical protein
MKAQGPTKKPFPRHMMTQFGVRQSPRPAIFNTARYNCVMITRQGKENSIQGKNIVGGANRLSSTHPRYVRSSPEQSRRPAEKERASVSLFAYGSRQRRSTAPPGWNYLTRWKVFSRSAHLCSVANWINFKAECKVKSGGCVEKKKCESHEAMRWIRLARESHGSLSPFA